MSAGTLTRQDPDACPAGCGRKVRRGHLTCGPCWREVPEHLQREVYRTWREYRAYIVGRKSLIEEGRAEARQAYMDAKDAAIGSIP